MKYTGLRVAIALAIALAISDVFAIRWSSGDSGMTWAQLGLIWFVCFEFGFVGFYAILAVMEFWDQYVERQKRLRDSLIAEATLLSPSERRYHRESLESYLRRVQTRNGGYYE